MSDTLEQIASTVTALSKLTRGAEMPDNRIEQKVYDLLMRVEDIEANFRELDKVADSILKRMNVSYELDTEDDAMKQLEGVL